MRVVLDTSVLIALAVAATAAVEEVPLLAYNVADLQIIEVLLDARRP